MRLPLAFTVLLLASAQALADEMAAPDDLSYWADWADGEQKEELPLPLEHFLQRMARRPRPQQFFGLMGKRDAGYGQISHKRHKTDSFVGLMGKRSLSSDYCSSDLEQEVKEQSFAIGGIELCRIL